MHEQALGDVFSAIAAALGAADKVIELIQRVPKMPEAGNLRPSTFCGRLELQDVSFSYPSRPTSRVLDSISLRVNPGEVSLWGYQLNWYLLDMMKFSIPCQPAPAAHMLLPAAGSPSELCAPRPLEQWRADPLRRADIIGRPP